MDVKTATCFAWSVKTPPCKQPRFNHGRGSPPFHCHTWKHNRQDETWRTVRTQCRCSRVLCSRETVEMQRREHRSSGAGGGVWATQRHNESTEWDQRSDLSKKKKVGTAVTVRLWCRGSVEYDCCSVAKRKLAMRKPLHVLKQEAFALMPWNDTIINCFASACWET